MANYKLWNALNEYERIISNHSFTGQRMKVTHIVGRWIEKNIVIRGIKPAKYLLTH